MFTALFWKATAERAVKTAAQSAIASIGTTAVIQSLDWAIVGGTVLAATVLSVLTSIASSGAGEAGTPSLVKDAI